MSLAIVGTDTEVGKTVISAVVLARYAARYRLAYWKPIATGSLDGRDVDVVRDLAPLEVEFLDEHSLFEEPLSPHLAARLEGRWVDPAGVRGAFDRHRAARPGIDLVIEGIGGLLVPLNDEGDLLADLFADLDLPCLLVARSSLGTINHTLLSLEALRAREIELAGVVLVGPHAPDNRQAIELFGEVDVIGEIEHLDPLDAETVAWAAGGFDPDGLLEHWFDPGARKEPAG